jgi:hypothetical protein
MATDRPSGTYRFIEPIESLRQVLRERYGVAADAADQTAFAGAGFVTLLDVLEHQSDDRAFMEDLVAKMAPGSVLLLTVPAFQSLWSRWDEALGHFRRYDKDTLAACLEGLPLEVTEMSYLFPEMVPLALWRKRKSAGASRHDIDEDAEFPDLPAWVNGLLVRMGTIPLALRAHWRTGTSLFLAARVEPARHPAPTDIIDGAG